VKIEVGKKYLTRSGNTVACRATGAANFLCVYTKTVENHQMLMGRQQLWKEDGSWVAFPGGVHDIVNEA
jgi:hypothetical protein